MGVSAHVLLTVYVLYPFDIILMECEVVCVDPLVERSHNGAGVIGVLQTQSMTELMDGNQEEVHTCKTDSDTCTRIYSYMCVK